MRGQVLDAGLAQLGYAIHKLQNPKHTACVQCASEHFDCKRSKVVQAPARGGNIHRHSQLDRQVGCVGVDEVENSAQDDNMVGNADQEVVGLEDDRASGSENGHVCLDLLACWSLEGDITALGLKEGQKIAGEGLGCRCLVCSHLHCSHIASDSNSVDLIPGRPASWVDVQSEGLGREFELNERLG